MSLLDSLISYWKLDEASGNAIDAHGTNTLTANNAPGSSAGIIGTARTFNGTNQFFSVANNSALQSGNASFSLQAWVNFDTLATDQMLAGKWRISFNNREYRLIFVGSQNRLFFQVSSAGDAAQSAIASNFGPLSTGAWYHVVGWYDSANQQIGISLNGVVNTASHTIGVFSGGANFRIGVSDDQSIFTDGLIDEVAFWKRALTADERTSLYNGGNGLSYDDFAAAGVPLVNGSLINHSLINRSLIR